MTSCIHHWLLEPPAGPASWGECKHCGSRREFRNDAADKMQWPLTSTAHDQASVAKKARHAARVGQHERQLYVE